MKSLFYHGIRLSFFFIILLAISCKKDVSLDEQSETVYPVSFNIQSFSKSKNFIKNAISKADLKASNTINSQNHAEGFLYLWTFNNENLAPDIQYRNSARTSITYDAGVVPNEFVNSTFRFENFATGKALNFRGGTEVLFKMPISDVQEVIRFGFDMGSTSTGPKDFEIYYSVDLGASYHIISLNNQFFNLATSTKNSYVYELAEKMIRGSELWIKIVLKEGNRIVDGASVGNYNPSNGAFRLDNVYLVGIAPPNTSQAGINKLHYYLIHQDKDNLVFEGDIDLSPSTTLSLDLPLGKYNVVFVSNSSNEELIFPSSISSSSFYLSNKFSNAQADVFGYFGTLDVAGVTNSNIELQRLFSQVKVEFTDAIDLSIVTKIVVNQIHDPIYFAPFAPLSTNPILDQSSIEFNDNFQVNKQLVFHQFIGEVTSFVPLQYRVEVFGANGLLRSFDLESSIKNNMQLVFRGELLKDLSQTAGFSISKNESWGDEEIVNF